MEGKDWTGEIKERGREKDERKQNADKKREKEEIKWKRKKETCWMKEREERTEWKKHRNLPKGSKQEKINKISWNAANEQERKKQRKYIEWWRGTKYLKKQTKN